MLHEYGMNQVGGIVGRPADTPTDAPRTCDKCLDNVGGNLSR